MNHEFQGERQMLYKIRVGDILLAENKPLSQTNAYLVVNLGMDEGFGLICLSCGSKVGVYGKDIQKFGEDINGFLNVKYIIPKEEICDYFNGKYKLKYKVKAHDIANIDDEFGLEIER